ncbi:MAG: DUF5104 domain-containing protein [Ruminococcus sp.]|nr:DUF5104 domain-containing protein [Ruminococcus sp.]
MAFISMIIMYVLVIAAIIFGIYVFGGILAIAGVVTRRYEQKRGNVKKYPKVLMAIGFAIMAIIQLFVELIVIYIAVESKNAVSDSDSAVLEGNMKALVEAGTENDADKLTELFAPTVANSYGFDDNAKEFVESFPDEIENLEYDTAGAGGKYSNGEGNESFGGDFTFESDGVTYYGHLSVNKNWDSDKNMEGITRLTLSSELVNVDFDFSFPSDDGVYSNVSMDYDFTAKHIYIYDVAWYHDDGVSYDEFSAFDSEERLDKSDVTDVLGEPNGRKSDKLIYLIDDKTTDEGNPLYAFVDFSEYYGFVARIEIYSDDGELESVWRRADW